MKSYSYARIGNPDNNRKFMIAKPFDVKDNTFKTHTILGDKDVPEYTKQYDKDYKFHVVSAKEDITYLNECEAKDAEWIALPYYNGNQDWKEVVKVVNPDTHMFIVREKIFIESHKELTEGIKLPNGRDNEILGCIYLEHLPTEIPKYEGDCDTRLTVYNTGAKYYKAALTIKTLK